MAPFIGANRAGLAIFIGSLVAHLEFKWSWFSERFQMETLGWRFSPVTFGGGRISKSTCWARRTFLFGAFRSDEKSIQYTARTFKNNSRHWYELCFKRRLLTGSSICAWFVVFISREYLAPCWFNGEWCPTLSNLDFVPHCLRWNDSLRLWEFLLVLPDQPNA
jgi:hypothetical protein